MDVILTRTNNTLNRLVRQHTKSNWGHAALLFADEVWHFDYNNKKTQSLNQLLDDKEVEQVMVYQAPILEFYREAIETYKERFNTGEYDLQALIALYRMNERNTTNLHNISNHYTCCSLLAKTIKDYTAQAGVESLVNPFSHWSQTIPEDFTALELVGRLK